MDFFNTEYPEIKNRIIITNKLAFAFPTNIPIVPGHLLICPKRRVATIDELTGAELLALFDLTRILKKSLIKTFNAEGFNYAWNEGDLAGQNIKHLHLHILPRKKGDAGIIDYEPRQFLYRPGSRAESPEKELLEITELIKKNL
ncbi:hypothetical protein A2316_03745 [Candidatus Falkowbacteria bacterium RIFOXYB2_FULL_38_15]|uniref:HIT domain-containing protein n=1 Tax=Candidatus Falkowbacteria bacterium RIFOXYA2_FULL_38_12 TaxID=1797993 RepID=A0A1F5S441_9BACT|nr:MAG: hypothetical protein A2257_00410 [Candidatus Falkowbacteria bacterium RIFOXYA2_FULL_38_12]OGF32205.1 MAG: hypothetical protein A2316_03745 [Candidatus Falkowbacteria bacterium RIFOXYB2_FULL_38_15]OGF44586.1 MAG: hypothetical protein A2555_00915 [Candidatus Falkowbacteria bacterium RIFOXYD2_FULL_39_16]